MIKRETRRRSSSKEFRKSKESTTKISVKVPDISYWTLFRFSSRRDKLLIAVSVLSNIIAGSLVPYVLTVFADVFRHMIEYAKDEQLSAEKDEKFLQYMYKFGVKYSMFGCIYFIGGYLGTAMLKIAAVNQVGSRHKIFRVREAYLEAALNQDFEFFDTHQTGDFASRMSDDMLTFEDGIGEKLSAVVYNATLSVGCVLMAVIQGWKLALLCLASTPVTFFLVGLTSKLAQRLSKKEALESSRAGAVAEEVIHSIRTVFAFNGQRKELARYTSHLRDARKTEVKKELFTGLSMGFLYFCVFSSYALCFYLGVYLIIHDPKHYDAGVMYEVFFGVVMGMSTLGMLGGLIGALGSARGAGASIFYLIDNKPTINPLADRGVKPDTVSGNIELKDVVFHYPSRPELNVLKGVNISVKRGHSAALVGHSGCGKSTIIQLVSRYYDAVSGKVLLDGHDVRDVSVVWLRGQIGLVGQEPVLFNTTVRENIRYGREGALDADVEAAARQANAHQFISKLPKGYDTQVGESGASLSGGQKQRIAIARALIRNPAILLLDEATSALDTRSEAKVQVALDKASEGRTTLIVAHRLSTIRNVDMIYVMKDGQVLETGNHDELVAKKGQYYDMLHLQEPHVAESANESSVALSHTESIISKKSALEEAADDSMVEDVKMKDKPPPMSFCRVVRMNSPEWKSILTGCVCSIVLGCGMPFFVLVYGQLFGSLASKPDEMMAQVVTSAYLFITLGFVMALTTLIEGLSFGTAGSRLTERIRTRMFENLLRLHVAFYDDRAHSTGALCAKLSAEAAYVRNATGHKVGLILQAFSAVTLSLILALVVEWRVALVAMSFFPFLAIIVIYQGKATSKESRGNAKVLEDSTKVAVEAISNVRTVQSLGRERAFLVEYVSHLRPALGPAKKSAHYDGVVSGLSRSMITFINALAITYGGYLMVTDDILYENIIIATQSLQMVSNQVQTAFTYAPDLQKGINAASRAVALMDTKPLIVDPVVPALTPFNASGAANFKNVDFRYPTRPGDKILRGLNLQIEQGKTIALVGQSGGGKSTVIQLLQRFYDPEAGAVCLDDTPLPSLRISEVRNSYGLVSQEPVLFDRSVGENIAYGDNSRPVSHDEIVAAARLANIHAFVESLPEGYNSNIGAKGVQLSGGQKQRIAIARALVRRPKILLLDEATSALDTESEQVVQEALDRAKAGRTCVTIAHRLSTIRDADAICVLKGGRVAEQGTHDELIAKRGLYFNLHGGNS